MELSDGSDETHRNESSSSDSSEGDNSLEGNQWRDTIARSVQLPDFLLTHSEYSAIDVPNIKNFKMKTDKTKKSKTDQAREFL